MAVPKKVTRSGLANLSIHRGQCYGIYFILEEKILKYAVTLVNLSPSNSLQHFVASSALSNIHKPLRPVVT